MATYQTRIKGDRLYHAISEGYGAPIELFGFTKEGETPMSLVTIALTSCITMCVQGYFTRFHQKKMVAILADTSYDDGVFKVQVRIAHALDQTMVSEILAYVDEQCRVKKILRDDLVYEISLEENHDI
ncbi:OsmC family peroxiredoxin [Streptococcus pluranimalium]|uniref:OsmC family peroxiredoxin n=1 Tax=Streptococcus pluranimalium TaxID=82348 RepID=UPI0039FBFD97